MFLSTGIMPVDVLAYTSFGMLGVATVRLAGFAYVLVVELFAHCARGAGENRPIVTACCHRFGTNQDSLGRALLGEWGADLRATCVGRTG